MSRTFSPSFFHIFYFGQSFGARRRRTPRACIESEGRIGKVSMRRIFMYLQIDTGPRHSPVGMLRDVEKNDRETPSFFHIFFWRTSSLFIVGHASGSFSAARRRKASGQQKKGGAKERWRAAKRAGGESAHVHAFKKKWTWQPRVALASRYTAAWATGAAQEGRPWNRCGRQWRAAHEGRQGVARR